MQKCFFHLNIYTNLKIPYTDSLLSSIRFIPLEYVLFDLDMNSMKKNAKSYMGNFNWNYDGFGIMFCPYLSQTMINYRCMKISECISIIEVKYVAIFNNYSHSPLFNQYGLKTFVPGPAVRYNQLWWLNLSDPGHWNNCYNLPWSQR